jgi:hypothetical protein
MEYESKPDHDLMSKVKAWRSVHEKTLGLKNAVFLRSTMVTLMSLCIVDYKERCCDLPLRDLAKAICISREMTAEVLKQLEEIGFISITPAASRRPKTIKVNFDNIVGETMPIKPAKEVKAERRKPVLQAVAAGEAKAAKTRAVKIDKGGVGALVTAWKQAAEESYPEYPAAVPAFFGKAKGNLQALHRLGVTGEDVDYMVRNWREIREKAFGWMKNTPPPEFLTPGFFVGFIDEIRMILAAQKIEGLREGVTQDRNALIYRYRMDGSSQSEAEVRADKMLAPISAAKSEADRAAAERAENAKWREEFDRKNGRSGKGGWSSPAALSAAADPEGVARLALEREWLAEIGAEQAEDEQAEDEQGQESLYRNGWGI